MERPGDFGQISRTPHSLTRRFRDRKRHSPMPSTSMFYRREMGVPATLKSLAVNGSPAWRWGRQPLPRTAHVKATRSACFTSQGTGQEL